MINQQNITKGLFQYIVIKEVMAQVQVAIIDISIKPDRKYVKILYLKDHF